MFGKVGRAGLNALKDRASCDSGSREVTPELLRAFDTILQVQALSPRRQISLSVPVVSRFLVASDAAFERDGMSCHVMSCLVVSLHVISRHVMSCHVV